MLQIREWFDVERKDKDGEWANKIIRFIRMQMQPLVDIKSATRGMAYMLGKQDMSPIRNLFQNSAELNLNNRPLYNQYNNRLLRAENDSDVSLLHEMANVDFMSLPIMEKLKNVFIAEMKKMGVIAVVKSTDPTSGVAKKNDEAFIVNKDRMEKFISGMFTQMGQPPFKMQQAKDRIGKKMDSGNTQDFDKMSLDRNDPADVATFMKYFHKLDWEIEMQKLVDAILKFNQLESFISNMTVDIIAKKAVAYQSYVSKVNGAVMAQYLTPETVYIFGGGRREDYNDASAKAYQQSVTIKELLDRFGDSFDIEKYMDKLIIAVFTASSGAIDITAIHPSGRYYCQGRDTGTNGQNINYTYNQFLNFKVTIGYMEWISQNMTEYGEEINRVNLKDLNNSAKVKQFEGTFYEDNQPPNGKRYQTKARYETGTYCSYYLVLTMVDHLMFDFGEVTYKDIEGYQDFNTNFTIITQKVIGEPIAITCAPFIDLINELWYKFKYEVRRSKPRGTDYNYDSLLAMAMDIFPDNTLNKSEKIAKMVAWLDGSANSMYTFPVIEGKVVPMTSNQVNIDRPNGLSPNSKIYWESLIEIWAKMLDTVGIAPLREGDPGNPRDSMNNQFKALEYSLASTYYIPDMITAVCEDIATRSLFFVQDIIQFKDIDTLAYRFLVNLVGEETLQAIEGMGKVGMHRYSVYVEAMNQSSLLQKIDTSIQLAVQNGKVSVAQQLMLEDIKSPRQKGIVLAYFEEKANKDAQQAAQQQQQAQQQHEMQMKQMDMQIEKMKGDQMLQGKTIDANATMQAHLINQKGGIDKTKMKLSGDVDQIYHQANADLLTEQQSLNNTGKTTPPPPAPPVQPQQQAPLPVQRAPSALQLEHNAAEPMPTTANV